MFAVQEREAPDLPEDPSGLSDGELERSIAELTRQRAAIEAKRLRYLAEAERRKTYRKDGHLSLANWIADRSGESMAVAKTDVRVASALEEMPGVREALSSGQVTMSAVRILSDARAEHPEAFAHAEGELVQQAATLPADALRHVVAEWSVRANENAGVDRDARLRRQRKFNIWYADT